MNGLIDIYGEADIMDRFVYRKAVRISLRIIETDECIYTNELLQ